MSNASEIIQQFIEQAAGPAGAPVDLQRQLAALLPTLLAEKDQPKKKRGRGKGPSKAKTHGLIRAANAYLKLHGVTSGSKRGRAIMQSMFPIPLYRDREKEFSDMVRQTCKRKCHILFPPDIREDAKGRYLYLVLEDQLKADEETGLWTVRFYGNDMDTLLELEQKTPEAEIKGR